MSFFKKLFGGSTDDQLIPYTDFQEGDVFYSYSGDSYHFFKTLKVDQDTATLHVLMYQELQQLPAAYPGNDFQQSLTVHPNSLLAVFSIGECYFKMGDFPNAKVFFEKAVEIDPNHEQPRVFLQRTLELIQNP